MKLAFGKSRASREEIEQDAAREIEALIASADDRPAIDWSVYGLPADIADPTAASTDLGAPAIGDEPAKSEPAAPPAARNPRARPSTGPAKKPRAPKQTTA
ncbi:MAG TPA: hypothetical protein VF711_02220 [Acidimicrobiales bacterium]|jgi:hypothetical protein